MSWLLAEKVWESKNAGNFWKKLTHTAATGQQALLQFVVVYP